MAPPEFVSREPIPVAHVSQVSFYDTTPEGFCAFNNAPGSGFCTMNYIRAHETDHWQGPFFDMAPTNAWYVDDYLQDASGKLWSRSWYGVMDDFGDLVEIEVREVL